MPDEKPIDVDTLRTNLNQLKNDPRYNAFDKFITSALEPMIGVASIDPQYAYASAAVINLIHTLQQEKEAGKDISKELQSFSAEKIPGSGILNASWDVDNVYQSNRDQIFNKIELVIHDHGDKIEVKQKIEAVDVPVVLVTLTQAQIGGMLDSTAFNNYPDVLKLDFETLKTFLDAHIPGWQDRYGGHLEDWRPLGDAKTIAEMVAEGFATGNQKYNYDPPMQPYFIDLLEASNDRFQLYNLRAKGCLVIVDIIAMRHPDIQRVYQRSLLDAFEQIGILTIAPTLEAATTAHDLSVVIQLKLAEMEFLRRIRDKAAEADVCKEIYGNMPDPDTPIVQWVHTRVNSLTQYHIKKNGAPTLANS